MEQDVFVLNGLSKDILDKLSYKSNLGISLKRNLHYFNKEDVMKEMITLVGWLKNQSVLEDVPIDFRIKSMESISSKFDRYYPGHQLRKVFDDILGFRAFCDSYDDVLEAFKLLMIQYNDDSGALSGSGYLISAGDMENSWMADFTAIGLKVYFNSLVNHTAVTELEDGETSIDDYIGYAYTSYGLHIMMVCFDPLQNIAVDNSIVDGKSYTGIGLNTELNLDGDTKYDTLKDSLLTNKESKTYDAWKNAKVTDDTVANHTVKNEKNLKSLLSDLDDK